MVASLNRQYKAFMSVFNKDAIKRLVKDIKYLKKNPLNDNNIYYHHNMDNIFEGYAMIIGNPDTVYRNGLYFFKFVFPTNYPYEPPKVYFHTRYNDIRFHPNFYRNGKVCLSILNTWPGEKWSSCQSIHSVLLTIASSFNETPLENEPYIHSENSKENYNEIYNTILKYANLKYCFCELIQTNKYTDNIVLQPFICFEDEIHQHFRDKIDDVLSIVQEESEKNSKIQQLSFSVYRYMEIKINYPSLLTYIQKIKKKMENATIHTNNNKNINQTTHQVPKTVITTSE
jgi:ubiquitin-protein ligase